MQRGWIRMPGCVFSLGAAAVSGGLMADPSTQVPAPFEFAPWSYVQSKSQFALFDPKRSKIPLVQEKYRIKSCNEGKTEISQVEFSTCAALSVHEVKANIDAVKTALFNTNYAKCINPDGAYAMTRLKIQKEALTIGIKDAEIDSIGKNARVYYLIHHNENAKKLLADLGKERGTQYVEAIAECWYSPSAETRQNVLDLAKALVPEVGDRKLFPAATFNALQDLIENPLNDKQLFVTLTRIRNNWNQGIPITGVTLPLGQ